MDPSTREALRGLPAVDEALRQLEPLFPDAPRWALVQVIRDEISRLRQRLLAGQAQIAALEPQQLQRSINRLLTPSLRPVLNATGVVLHTNLGRAPLSEAVLRRICAVARGYSTLEYDLDQRRRGSRHVHAAELVCAVTGAEDAVVVNNNAAAVLLVLSALARGKEVVVSRGELIEIGGSFRLPDVMHSSGALLREVGTTNRTHPRDYRQAVGEQTALLMKAHRSNFALVGFTKEVSAHELVQIGRELGLPTYFDLGSGCLLEPSELGLGGSETVQQAVRTGCDLVSFSGDKLLGGPQAGIIVGGREWIAQLRAHPLMRPLRPDKMTLAGLTATLDAYRDGRAQQELPALAALTVSAEALRRRAGRLRDRLRRRLGRDWTLALAQVESRVGGGALPSATPASWAVALGHASRSPDQIEALLRQGEPPVVARIEDDRLLLDVRTVREEQLKQLVASVGDALQPRTAAAAD